MPLTAVPSREPALAQQGTAEGGCPSEILVPDKFDKVTSMADTLVGSRRVSRPGNEGNPVFPYATTAGLCRIIRCTGKM